jgi:hypothetical protein
MLSLRLRLHCGFRVGTGARFPVLEPGNEQSDIFLKWMLIVVVIIVVDLAWLLIGVGLGSIAIRPRSERAFNLPTVPCEQALEVIPVNLGELCAIAAPVCNSAPYAGSLPHLR